MAKGIRVNQLAKELGYPSKDILDRCKLEGLESKVPNHMTVLGPGLEATLREWFPERKGVEGAVATAVEEAPVAPSRRPAKHAPAEVPPAAVEPTDPAEPLAMAPPAPPPAKPAVQAPVLPPPPLAPEPKVTAVPPAPPRPPVEPPEPDQGQPAAPPPAPPVAAIKPGEVPRLAPRPTITLENRPQAPGRKSLGTAPQMVSPEPAKIQGPRVVREEKPDKIAVPRARRPEAAAPPPPAFVQARPQPGRGVKSADDETEEGEARKKAAKAGPRTNSGRRRGVDGRRGEAMEKLKEFSEADLIERRDRLATATTSRIVFDSHLKKSSERGQHALAKTTVQKGQPVEIEEPITVKSLAAALGIKGGDIIAKLMKQGTMATINQTLDPPVAESIALEYGLELRVTQQQALEDQVAKHFAELEASEVADSPRPPVVTILGHVDHGKTSLLDRIRHANVAAGEAGGITQHTAAWMVQLGEKRVTFIDTPGHQAFTAMRARGAGMTDVVVLVVSAAEGVQPQTIESIDHARAAGVPIVVALNKIDRADANVQAVLGQLAAQGLNPTEWGGTTDVIKTSATTGQGIEDLIEILDYQSELLGLKAHEDLPARGVVIESRIDPGMGPAATVLVQNGTLKVGQIMLAGPGHGRIRSLLNDRNESLKSATPAMPVVVSGLDQLPSAGDRFYVMDDPEQARAVAEERRSRSRQTHLGQHDRVTLANLVETIEAGQVKTINLIIKADVQGSAETLTKAVTEANTDEVKIHVIHAGVGPVNESDVELADASNAVIIGFQVVPEDGARVMAEQRRVEIRLYRIIYEILDDLKKALSGLLEPEIREKMHGHAEIRQIIKVSRIGNVAGCMVTDGHIQRGSKIRLIRNGTIVAQDLALDSLRRVKDDVREVKAGLECGMKISGYDDVKIGDVVEAYTRETIQRTL